VSSGTDRRPIRVDQGVDHWRSFWFRPQSTYPLGAVRIAFGVLLIGWSASLLPSLYDYFGPDGLLPRIVRDPYRWTIFTASSTNQTVLVCWIALFVSSIALAFGWHSRIASLMVCVLVLSFQSRDPSVFNGGDAVIRAAALFLALSPCGTALSLDQRRRTGRFWSDQLRAPWALRLMQILVSIIYLGSVRTKVSGQTWPNGTAVSYALRLEDMLILPTPHWLTSNALLMNGVTWLVVAIEFSIGVFVWNRRLRPWVLTAGVLMHTGIAVSVAVGFFSPAMFVLYLTFASPETIKQLPSTLSGVIRRFSNQPKTPTAEPISHDHDDEPSKAEATPPSEPAPTIPKLR
jgi:hypothetical protein